MAGPRPPQTYQEWLDLLGQMERSRSAESFARLVREGTLRCPAHMLPRMEARVESAVNQMLRRTTRWYTGRINEALEDGDYSCLTLQFYRLRRDIPGLRFYRSMDFLSPAFVEELDRQVLREVTRYREFLVERLWELAEETHNDLLEDEVWQITRIRFDKDAQTAWGIM